MLALYGDVTLGLPASGFPAVTSSSLSIFKNGAPDTSGLPVTVTYSQPSGTTLSNNTFTLSKGSSVTVPVTVSFSVTNSSNNMYGVRLNQISWMSNGGKSASDLTGTGWSTPNTPVTPVTPTPQPPTPPTSVIGYHSADLNHDWKISDSELAYFHATLTRS